MPDRSGEPSARAPRVAVVGVSETRPCGVRDHAVLLSEALDREGVRCSEHWLWRGERSLPGARAEFRAWLKALAGELDAARPETIVLHYSVFSYSYRGVPLFVRPLLAVLRASGAPLITFVHEPAYPWRLGGLRGKVWALTQRAVLVGVMRDSAAVLVTAPFRADWLACRPWFARRPVALAPVFSNLPPPAASAPRPQQDARLLGLFGYAYEGAARSLVLDALRELGDRGLRVRLALLGAPGAGTPAAEAWLADARRHGVERALSFSGVLPAQELSNALAACEVLLHAETSGPTSRKGTLAASLASGRPVVAIDGPLRWPELIDSGALVVAQPTAWALADALAGLLEDDGRREALGVRGGAFARQAMGVERSARELIALLEELASDAAPQDLDAVRLSRS